MYSLTFYQNNEMFVVLVPVSLIKKPELWYLYYFSRYRNGQVITDNVIRPYTKNQ